jgi:hypothetical protein
VVHTQVLKSAVFRLLLKVIPHLVVDSTSPLAIAIGADAMITHDRDFSALRGLRVLGVDAR